MTAASVDGIGGRVRFWRRYHHLTQEQLATMAGLSVTTISKVERGHVRPSWRVVRRIAIALDVAAVDLLPPDHP